ncbi:MAG: hypothetical protein A2V67_20525 [Deltaproteobacteria bacterium RBG_13_61_14]|nr:MAG: hypothetical protein A2V67_20525 [Deltaproteobacteria bacterium RBG_13_61_14]
MFGKRSQTKRIEELEVKLAKSQEYITDILTFSAGEKALSASASPNPYDNREKLIDELVKKYKGYARYGNQLIQRLVDTRAALAMAGGLKAVARDPSAFSRELALIQEMVRLNELDGQFGQSLAVEKELEGQVLLILEWDAEAGNVRLRFLSWNDTRYEVDYDDELYSRILRIRYRRPGNDRQEVVIPAERAVLIKFNARIHSREGIPTLSGLLVEAEDIDKALRDWRQINRYFASPTPYFRTEDLQEAKDLYDRLLSPGVNWKIGKVFAGPAEFSLVGMDSAGVESIRQEIETKVKILAGGAGVPVQFLGFPEFMSNRATAENTMEPVALVSIAEQRSWIGGFKDLFDKAVRLRNLNLASDKAPFQAGGVEPRMKFITQAQVDRLSALYLPLWEKGAISLKTLLSLLPDIEPEAEEADLEGRDLDGAGFEEEPE